MVVFLLQHRPREAAGLKGAGGVSEPRCKELCDMYVCKIVIAILLHGISLGRLKKPNSSPFWSICMGGPKGISCIYEDYLSGVSRVQCTIARLEIERDPRVVVRRSVLRR